MHTAAAGVGYYLQLNHRNSIETWSNPFYYDALSYQAEYNFKSNLTQAYGNNMIQVDGAPVAFANYGGDVNQDRFVDLFDIALTYNDASSFVTGYVVTDVTGNDITDLTDLILVYNNSTNFVQAVVPPGAAPQVNYNNNIFGESGTTSDPSANSNGNSESNFIKIDRPASEDVHKK